jgi:shikimate kinase
MENQTSCVFLVGMPGSGKSTIGRGLAKALHRPFIDLDQAIEDRCGVAIPVIFEIEGEQGFRKRESMVLQEVTASQSNAVVATGGGAILAQQNRKVIADRGVVIYLKASLDELVRRTSRDRNRPLLVTDDPKARLQALFDQRSPLYEQAADLVFETGAAGVSATVQLIVSQLKQLKHD